ncbi:hypothetical protein PF011_g21082 [Phytophthora fragariae]|uniref:RxLR effector PexRD54 WY domain-containing protein n=1 Tax=Phytophthora fragariae TaxID=53985 RepID=A0A6A3INM7_9STRA|nr:hypothetical protein PF011_g21082 [Phytophthora fragariae]
MIEEAAKFADTNDLATKLQKELGQYWIATAKIPDDVFHAMYPGKIEHNILSNREFTTWAKYADDFNAKYPEQPVSMAPALRKILKEDPDRATRLLNTLALRFSDKALNQFLRAAMKFPSMEKAATTIQTEKIYGYLMNNQSPQKVFKWLDIDNVGNNLLSDPLFAKWMKYAKEFNKKNPKHQESWFTPILMSYDPELVIKTAMNDPSTVKIAKLVQRELSKRWLDLKKPPQDVFHLIGLNHAGDKTLASSDFKVWTKYLNDFNQRYPTEKTTMLDGLMDNYNEISLLQIFDAAKKDPRTEKLATNLQNALINQWIVVKKNPADLKRRFNGVLTSDEMIARYVEKLKALSGTTS